MINEIKEALEKATSGEWIKDKAKHRDEYGIMSPAAGWLLGTISKMEDAHLIANTPTYIRYLLDELEKAQEEITRLNGKVDYKSTIVGYSVELIEDLEKENAAMKEALEWYGDMEHYTVLPGAQLTGTEKDMGYRARKVLSTLTKEAPNE